MPAHPVNKSFDGLLSPEEVARVCGLSRRAVYRAIARGELRASRLCHRLRVRPADLKGWIEREMLTPPAATVASVHPSRRAPRGSLREMLNETQQPKPEQ